MHRHILVFAAALSFLSKGDLNAQVPPCAGPLPDRVYGTFGHTQISDAAALANGGAIACGYVYGASAGLLDPLRYGSSDGLVMKLAYDGSIIWSKTLGAANADRLVAVAAIADGGFLVAGTRNLDAWYLRMDDDGNILWEVIMPPPPGWYSNGVGDVFILGASAVLLTGPGTMVIDLDDGSVISESSGIRGTHGVASADGGYLVALDLPGEVGVPWVGGYAPPRGDVHLTKVDDTGAISWTRRIRTDGWDTHVDLLANGLGYLLVCTVSSSNTGGDRSSLPKGERDFWVLQLDQSGDIIWERTFGGPGVENPAGVLWDNDGTGFLLYGSTNGSSGGDITEDERVGPESTFIADVWICKIDASGAKVWDKRIGGGGYDGLYKVVNLASGYLACGITNSRPGFDRSAPLEYDDDDHQQAWFFHFEPGIPSTWYADLDHDGYGDPASSVVSCTAPVDHVVNSVDCDPLTANAYGLYMGAACNDGFLFTFPDRVGEDCTCQGSIPDFLFDNFTFRLVPDAFALSLTMELFEEGNANVPVITRGPWPNAQPGVPITEQFQLPPGAYTMRVFDALGDGILGGGFTLEVNGKRLIQADGAFQQLSEAPLGFEVPLGDRSLTTGTCDRLDLLPSSSIIASPHPMVSVRNNREDASTGYQFWIFNPHGGYSRRIFQSLKNPGNGSPPGPDGCAHLKLSNIITNPLPQMVLLNVRVRTMVDGIYEPFGPACTIKIDPYAGICPTTQLVSTPGPNFSCNVQKSFGGSSKVVANAVTGANKYQFEFVEPINGYKRRITSANNTRLLNWTTQQPLCGTFTYQVRVRVSFDGGQNWCPWGPTCPVTIANYQAGCTPVIGEVTDQGQRGMEAPSREPLFRVYPTVTEQRVLWLQAPGTGDLQVEVVSLTGRLDYTGRLAVPYASVPVELALPAEIAPGIYLVRMVQADARHTERVVLR